MSIRNRKSASRRRTAGQSLIVCLMVLAFMTAVLGSVSVGLMAEARYVRRNGKSLAAFYVAKAGLEAAVSRLAQDDRGVDALGDPWCRERGGLTGTMAGDGTSKYECTVVDEEGRININKADRGMLRALDPGFTDAVATAIVTQRRERAFTRVEDLTSVSGVSEELLMAPRVKGSLTVYGEGKVNVNTAPLAVLQCLVLGEGGAEKVAQRRNGEDGLAGTEDDEPFTDIEQVKEIVGMSDEKFGEARPWLTVSSTHFTITGTGWSVADPRLKKELRQVVRREKSEFVVLRFEELR